MPQSLNCGSAPARPRADKQVEAREQRTAFLEGKLKKKEEVLAELREEHVALKKVLGDLIFPQGAPRAADPEVLPTGAVRRALPVVQEVKMQFPRHRSVK